MTVDCIGFFFTSFTENTHKKNLFNSKNNVVCKKFPKFWKTYA